ncbi:Acg family FMN-binding oxidoreductase [Falsiroseomonas stagni]|uniref:Nitroreductase family protein n=1 Tax=Falsiroseomonas stagni DSM 19981 TaxID=1123062 RepID=A0A1I4E3G4_9PROT|nr:hypothetical protein [Falsiroseomonas stagni]SFK99107.1 hypothetical protein SAMN02745775_11393 [Falsiroseomonas stagni DSM 19981]
MTISRRLLLSAGLAGMALSRTARGQVVSAADPAAPWEAAPAAAQHPDPRVRALAWAVLAPNPHNRQPWIAELPDAAPDAVVLRCDLDRRLPVTDPFDRQITIGLGAFVELFRMAAAQQGFSAVVTPFPEGEPRPRLDGRPVAVIRLAPGGVADPLFADAAARRSVKRPFDLARPVPEAALAVLAATVDAPRRFGATTAPARVEAIRDLAWRAWLIEARDEAAHLESVDLMRFGRAAVAANPDGISIYGPGLDEAVAAGQLTRDAMLPGRPGYDIMIQRYTPMLAATPAYVWTTSPGNSRAEALASGRDWLRINLAATGLGLSLHPVSQALQEFSAMAGPYAEAQAMLGGGGVVQMLGRLGYGPTVPATPRWAVETRIRRA